MRPRTWFNAASRSALAVTFLLGLAVLTLGGCPIEGAPTGGTEDQGASGVNSPPTLTFIRPTVDVTAYVGQTLEIAWTDQDPDDNATVKLYYDEDGLAGTGDEVLLVATTENPDGAGADTYAWNLGTMPPGTYYVLAEIDDGVNDAVTVYLPYTITIEPADAAVRVIEPSNTVQVLPAQNVVLSWTDKAPLHNASVTLFYDTDQNYANGIGGEIVTVDEDPDGDDDTYVWNVPAIRAGFYFIGARLVAGDETVIAYSQGRVQVASPALSVVSPAADVTLTDTLRNVLIGWQDDAPGVNATIRVFYDTDTDPDNGFLIITTTTEDPDGTADTHNWSVPTTLGSGTYYVGVQLDDGVNEPTTVYALGRVFTGEGSSDPNDTSVPPKITLMQPSQAAMVSTGATVTISWTDTAGGNATITLFYDLDGVPDSGDETVIAAGIEEDDDGPDDQYVWTIPDTATGSLRIGATIDDGVNTPVTAYAAGVLQILDRNFFARDLAAVEANLLGRTFRGFASNGRLGEVMPHIPWVRTKPDPKASAQTVVMYQPGISTNGDAYDDFVIVAPKGNPNYLERRGAGEAYLILSDPALLFAPPVVGILEPLTVNATGTPALPGATFPGPATTSTTEGIRSVAMSRDADNDGVPEIAFGMPYVANWVQEGQDYDPWDDWVYDIATNDLGDHYFASYPDDYRLPDLSDRKDPDGAIAYQPLTGWETIDAGAVVIVSGENDPFTPSTTDPSWAALPTVIPLDNVGQSLTDPHPRVVRGFTPFGNAPGGPEGVRLYCPWFLEGLTFGGPQYLDFPDPFELPGATSSDRGFFGASMVEADLDGDGAPEWIVAQPRSQAGTVNEGRLYVFWSDRSRARTTLWSDAIPFQNNGRIEITNITIDVDGVQTVEGTDIYESVADGDPSDVRVWSWPYAVADATLRLERITQEVEDDDPIEYYQIVSDGMSRRYVWPVITDMLRGDAVDAPAGALTGLGTVRGFMGATSGLGVAEDFTVGAPAAAPGGLANAGCSYLVFGRQPFGDHSLDEIGVSLEGIKVRGTAAQQRVGTSQASAGDFNGDGLCDWVIGAPGYTHDGVAGCGAVAIVYGSRSVQGVFNLSDIGNPDAAIPLPGVLFVGEAADDNAGASVAGVGDVDGDGYDDVAIVAPGASFTFADGTVRDDCGVVYLIYGGPTYTGNSGIKELADLGTSTLPGKIYVGAKRGNSQVTTVAAAGDVNDDGLSDFLIGDPTVDITNLTDIGEVYLIRGSGRMVP